MVKGEVTILTIDDHFIVVENGGVAEVHTNIPRIRGQMVAKFKQENWELHEFSSYAPAIKYMEETYGSRSNGYRALQELEKRPKPSKP
jgi:hypothetical protein